MTKSARWREELVLCTRLTWPEKTKIAVMLKCDGKCAKRGCGRKTGLDIDHIIPLALGGPNDLKNLQLLCEEHHKEKTRDDIRKIAKAKRLAKKETEEREPSRLQSPGFDKTKSRGFDGVVVPRT
jgi:5-methylcytosine-specific restriction endonuclease McrA